MFQIGGKKVRNLSYACVAVLSGGAVGVPCVAQVAFSNHWEVSSDDGATWQNGNLHVPHSTPSVLARYIVSWDQSTVPPPGGHWYPDAIFDPTITGASPGDSVSEMMMHLSGFWVVATAAGPLTVQDMGGGLLKIDNPIDTQAPGQGPSGARPRQGWGIGEAQSSANPIRVFQFRLTLDGSLGTREFASAFATNPATNGPWLRMWTSTTVRANAGSLVNTGASVTVIPTPAWWTLGACTIVAARRRR
jgi:hypothetical protein